VAFEINHCSINMYTGWLDLSVNLCFLLLFVYDGQ
jgi:hypothetical protein